MKQNNSFSLNRLMSLIIQSLILNKKLLGITVAGATGILFISLMFLQRNINFTRWDQGNYMVTFMAFFLLGGILWTGQSFPAFRSREKSIAYLMIPATRSEKFIMELLTRIVAFIIFMPILFWIVANLEGAIVHYYNPELDIYTFSFSQGWTDISKNAQLNFWNILAYIQIYFFFLIAGFTGACHFSKSPLSKTIFVFLVAVVGYSFLIFLLIKGLKIYDYIPYQKTILSIQSKEEATALFSITSTVVNLTLLVVAWFRFKEREA